MVKLWLKKLSAVLITFMALGMYIPPTYLDAESENSGVVSEKTNINDDFVTPLPDAVDEGETDQEYDLSSTDYIISAMTEQAKEQAVAKLGPRILQQVEVEFKNDILPNIEEVVHMLLVEAKEDLPYYVITEQPAQGYGEKIFNVYDYRTKQDIVRFHVRRDNRPGEGYWFNFHYHLSNDGYEEHHYIGEIYWDKNTPPKWMS